MSNSEPMPRYAIWRAACLGLALLGALIASFAAISSLSADGELKIGPLHGSLLLGGLMLSVISVEAARHVREAQDAVALFRHYRSGLLLWSISHGLLVILVIAYRRFGPGHAIWFLALLAGAGVLVGLLLIIRAKLMRTADDLGRLAESTLIAQERLAVAVSVRVDRTRAWAARATVRVAAMLAHGGVLTLGGLVVAYRAFKYFSAPHLDLSVLANYSYTSRRWAILISLLMLFVVLRAALLAARRPAENQELPSLWRAWLTSFLVIAIFAQAVFLYVDPHSRFGWNRFPPASASARLAKAESFERLAFVPDIVILGSSRAYTLSPEYLRERTGLTAFNMSVEGAVNHDYLVELNYLLERHAAPRLLIIEFSEANLQLDDFLTIGLQPLALLPYLPPEYVPDVLTETLADALSMQALSDSMFLLNLPEADARLRIWTFEPDGLAVRQPVSPERYKQVMTIPVGKQFLELHQCADLKESSKSIFEKMLNQASQNNIGVVLYRSPLNRDYLDDVYAGADVVRLTHCVRTVHDYLNLLAETYPNVFVHDLWDYRAVTDLAEAGYYDRWHLKPMGSQGVVEALLPQIQAAWQWAQENQPPAQP